MKQITHTLTMLSLTLGFAVAAPSAFAAQSSAPGSTTVPGAPPLEPKAERSRPADLPMVDDIRSGVNRLERASAASGEQEPERTTRHRQLLSSPSAEKPSTVGPEPVH